jgi:hypothetical protein
MGTAMILSDLILTTRINQHWDTSGMDSLEQCLNKQHFLDYPHPVEYQYNSRGFRDSEWPNSIDELKNAIWCVGDSFTVGLGSPYEFTWPQVLAKATGRRCINISMDGASNDWISRRAQQIIQEVNPTHMVVLWSYFHRRESPDTTLSDEARMIHSRKSSSYFDDIVHFFDCYKQLHSVKKSTKIFNGTIPSAGLFDDRFVLTDWNNIRDPSWNDRPPKSRAEFDALPSHIQHDILTQSAMRDRLDLMFFYYEFLDNHQLLSLTNLDYARDYHHFDKLTSDFFVQAACSELF